MSTSTVVHASAMEAVVSGRVPEILQFIFERFVRDWEMQRYRNSEDGPFSEYGIADLWLFLRSISGVSCTWRAIARGTPTLWRNVSTSELSYAGDAERSSLYGQYGNIRNIRYSTVLCLKRSAKVPIRILAKGTLWALQLFESLDEEDLLRVEDCHILGPCRMGDSGHWLGFARDEVVSNMQNALLSFSFPRLRSLTIISDDLDLPTFISMVTTYMSLESVIINHYSFSSFRPRGLIKSRTRLESHLKGIYISTHSFRDDVVALFEALSVPMLEALEIFVVDLQWKTVPEWILSSVCGAWEALRVLAVRGTLSLNDVHSLLSLSPNLEILEAHPFGGTIGRGEDIRIVASSRAVLEILLPGRPKSCCYKLRTLRVAQLYPDSEALLHELIDDRAISRFCFPLKELCIDRDAWASWCHDGDMVKLTGKVNVHDWQPEDL